MVQTVYVALSGTHHEGAHVLGVASTADKAKAVCQKDADDLADGAKASIAWNGLRADQSDDDTQYYEIKACVVDSHEYDAAYFAS